MRLIKAFQSGDRGSFESLFQQYFQRLCAFAIQYLHDKDEVEDLVQEVFITLWQKRMDFENEAALKGYMYTAVRNKCLNHLKHQSVVQKHEKALIHELQDDDEFNRKVIEEEVYGQLYEEVNALPTSAQNIMLLVLKGKKNKEIAELLDISENTVKTQKKIAYARLKERIKPEFFTFLLSL